MLGKTNWRKRACAALVLCVTTAIALPAQTFTTLHSFDGADGWNSNGLVQGTDGNLYGTTLYGGTNTSCYATSCGTVFKMTPSGTLTTLYSFCAQVGCADGENPNGALVQAANGDFYGTTLDGGTNCAPACGGTIFKITPGGTLSSNVAFRVLP